MSDISLSFSDFILADLAPSQTNGTIEEIGIDPSSEIQPGCSAGNSFIAASSPAIYSKNLPLSTSRPSHDSSETGPNPITSTVPSDDALDTSQDGSTPADSSESTIVVVASSIPSLSPSSASCSGPFWKVRHCRKKTGAVVTLLGLVVGVFALWLSYKSTHDGHISLELSQWTSQKDWIEFCQDLKNSANPDCIATQNVTLHVPPNFNQHSHHIVTKRCQHSMPTCPWSSHEAATFAYSTDMDTSSLRKWLGTFAFPLAELCISFETLLYFYSFRLRQRVRPADVEVQSYSDIPRREISFVRVLPITLVVFIGRWKGGMLVYEDGDSLVWMSVYYVMSLLALLPMLREMPRIGLWFL